MWNWLSLCLTVLPISAWLIHNHLQARRGQTGAAYAARHGMGFNAGDPFRLTDLPFVFFDDRHGYCSNTTWATYEGVHVACAEYTRGKTNGHTVSIAITDFPYNVPPLSVYARGMLGIEIHHNPVELPRTDFNKRFAVECDYAHEVLDLLGDEMMDWLMECQLEFGFEFSARRLLVFAAGIEKPDAMFNAVRRTLDSVTLPLWAHGGYSAIQATPLPLAIPA